MPTWVTVLPVIDEETRAFVGAITSQDVLEIITSEASGER